MVVRLQQAAAVEAVLIMAQEEVEQRIQAAVAVVLILMALTHQALAATADQVSLSSVT
jgi:hypothetical protein